MRRGTLWVVLLVIVAVLVIVGYDRGWYSVSRTDSPEGDKTDVRMTIDKNKIRNDAERAKSETKRGLSELSSDLKRGVEKVKTGAEHDTPATQSPEK